MSTIFRRKYISKQNRQSEARANYSNFMSNRNNYTTQELDEWPRQVSVLTLELHSLHYILSDTSPAPHCPDNRESVDSGHRKEENSLHYILSDTSPAPHCPYNRESVDSGHRTEDLGSVKIQGMVRSRSSADSDWWHDIDFFMGDDCFIGYEELWNRGDRWQKMICRLRGMSSSAATFKYHNKIAFEGSADGQLVWHRWNDRDLGFARDAAAGNDDPLELAEGRDRIETEEHDGVSCTRECDLGHHSSSTPTDRGFRVTADHSRKARGRSDFGFLYGDILL